MPKAKKGPAPARPSSPPTAQVAFDHLGAELAALEPDDYATINIDISQAVSLVLGALPGISAYSERLQALPQFEARWVEQLETYVLGAWFAHLQAIPGTPSQSEVRRLVDEATALRAALLGDADALVRRGVFDAQAVATVRAGQGHVDLANDLVVLSTMFLQAWDTIGGRTLATMEEVERAAVLGPALIAALGAKAGAGTGPNAADAADQRARAYTLFVRAYGEVRRGLYYLRWHEGDADLIAPSLYRGRGGRGAGALLEPPPPPAPELGTPAPVPVPEATPHATNGAAPTNGGSPVSPSLPS